MLEICLAVLLVGASGEGTAELRLIDGDGCAVSADRAVLWGTLLGDRTIYQEAERADVLKLQAGKELCQDQQCSGGGYVAFVTQAEFDLNVTKSATYQGWARCFLPYPGSWGHNESMDGGRRQLIRESTRQIFGQWFWSKLGRYQLGPGAHRFVLHGWPGSARIDAILFTDDPDVDPTSLIGRPPSDDRPNRGTVATAPIRPSAVQRWRQLTVDADLNGGRVAAEVSTDNGKTWTACPETGDLTNLRSTGDGNDTLTARLTLSAAPDCRSPLVRSVRVGYALTDDAEAVVANRHYAIAVARKTGRLCGIFNSATNTPVTSAHLQAPLVGLAVRMPTATEQTAVAPRAVLFGGLEASDHRLALRYSALDGRVQIRVEMVSDAGPLCRWRCEVANNSQQEVIRIDFPLIAGAAIGDYRDDECVIPRTGGWRIKTPARDKTWSTTYMGGGSMGWLDLCDDRAGLYVAMQDKDLKTTLMECAPAEGRRAVDLAMRTHSFVAPGKTVTRNYVVGVHTGDWHWAADRYREWAATWMKCPRPPEWVKWCDGWSHATERLKFEAMPAHLRRVQDEGLEYMQYWGHMADGVDQCCGNFYWPAPVLGGAEGFKSGVSNVHARGGRVTAYMNCQTWTRDSYKTPSLRMTPKTALPDEALDLLHPLDWFEQWRLYPLDGQPMGYYAGTLGWYIMCPASEGFQEHLRFWIVDMYCKRFGADGVYIDQTGATAAKPCYNLAHGHDDVGDWGAGNVELLKTCVEQARAHNPDFTISIEGAGDALGQYADMHLISGLCTHPEVYHYTFPEHILLSGVANSSHLTRKQRVSRAFLNGDRFDTTLGDWEMQSAVRLRKRIKRWLYPGRFMDDVGLRVSDDRVLARWNVCDEPGAKAIVLTVDNEHAVADATCMLTLPDGWRNPRAVFLFDREGGVRTEKVHVEADSLRLSILVSTLSAGLLAYEINPSDSVDAWCAVCPDPAGVDRVALCAANYSPRPIDVQTTLSAEGPLRVDGTPTTLSLPPQGVVRKPIHLDGFDELDLPAVVNVDASWPDGKRRQTSLVRPMVSNGSLEVDADGDGTPDGWRANGSLGSTFLHGTGDGAAWIEGQPKQTLFLIQLVRLLPETRYTFAGRIRRSTHTKGIYIAVAEHVGQHGLRLHPLGGDDKLPVDTWQRFETTFTTGKTFRVSAIYLYNIDTEAKAWFDAIELRPAEPK